MLPAIKYVVTSRYDIIVAALSTSPPPAQASIIGQYWLHGVVMCTSTNLYLLIS